MIQKHVDFITKFGSDKDAYVSRFYVFSFSHILIKYKILVSLTVKSEVWP